MKQLIVLSMLTAFIYQPSFGCMPPRSSYVIQGMELVELTKNKEVQDKIFDLAGSNHVVSSISYEKRSYVIQLSSGCGFQASPKYIAPPSNGMCPRFGGFDLSPVVCK